MNRCDLHNLLFLILNSYLLDPVFLSVVGPRSDSSEKCHPTAQISVPVKSTNFLKTNVFLYRFLR